MKKLLFVAFFICAFNFANSQNITYTPFIRGDTDQSQHQTRQQTQKLRATAYQVDYNGNYTKIPIQVTVTTYFHPTGDTSQEVKVTSYYRSNGYGGQWENCMYGAQVQQCQSMLGNGLEQSFMFKANLPMIGWVYFDL
ncbi:hypothetical protein [uncultured Alistipes sp.]|uniref:hypothetical protein n=1 Tax=uncultured Alistipes sp. TaxID=538949 RepID=UPI00266FEAED|nr:hypothetical protein [uncultured Alistipes sp.]